MKRIGPTGRRGSPLGLHDGETACDPFRLPVGGGLGDPAGGGVNADFVCQGGAVAGHTPFIRRALLLGSGAAGDGGGVRHQRLRRL